MIVNSWVNSCSFMILRENLIIRNVPQTSRELRLSFYSFINPTFDGGWWIPPPPEKNNDTTIHFKTF